MNLNFTKANNGWVTEFEVTDNFNLHIERTKGGDISIYQRTVGSKYAHVDFKALPYQRTIDVDVTGLVYPKYIKIVSEVEPTLAEIVTDGEVTEIKAQAKEIEVTTNGTTEVIPDSGFAYLSKVNIKTNVPTAGGGSSIEYFAYDKNNLPLSLMRPYATIEKSQVVIESQGVNELIVLPGKQALQMASYADSYTLIAIGIDWSLSSASKDGVVSLIDSMLVNGGGNVTKEDIAALPRITEEEFYNLNA